MISSEFEAEFDHAQGANLDYGFDWSAWLEVGEQITGSSWSATTGLTLTRPFLQNNICSVFAQGGVAGSLYQIVNTITTNNQTTGNTRTDSRTIILSCKNR